MDDEIADREALRREIPRGQERNGADRLRPPPRLLAERPKAAAPGEEGLAEQREGRENLVCP